MGWCRMLLTTTHYCIKKSIMLWLGMVLTAFRIFQYHHINISFVEFCRHVRNNNALCCCVSANKCLLLLCRRRIQMKCAHFICLFLPLVNFVCVGKNSKLNCDAVSMCGVVSPYDFCMGISFPLYHLMRSKMNFTVTAMAFSNCYFSIDFGIESV